MTDAVVCPRCPECSGYGWFLGRVPCDACANTGTMTKDAYIASLLSRLAVVERERDEARRVKYEPRVGDVVEIADEDLECVVASVGDDSCHLWRIVDGQFSRCFVMRAARFVRAATLDELIGAKSRMQLRPSLEPKP